MRIAKGSVISPVTGLADSISLSIKVGSYELCYFNNADCWSVLNLPDAAVLERAYNSFDAGVLSRQCFAAYVFQAKLILENELSLLGYEKDGYKGLRFLDYGCGGGHFVKAAQELGLEAMGMELDEVSVEWANIRGLSVVYGTLPDNENLLGSEKFDIIMMMHVLEHVPKPINVLRLLVDRLNPGGSLLIGVPDQKSFPSRLKVFLRLFGVRRNEYGFVQPPIHLHGFSMAGLLKLAAALGLEVVRKAKISPLDRRSFPSTDEYWRGINIQKLVYRIGSKMGSPGYLSVCMKKPLARD